MNQEIGWSAMVCHLSKNGVINPRVGTQAGEE